MSGKSPSKSSPEEAKPEAEDEELIDNFDAAEDKVVVEDEEESESELSEPELPDEQRTTLLIDPQ